MPNEVPEVMRVELPMGPELRSMANATIVRGPEDIIADNDMWLPIRTLIQGSIGADVEVHADSIDLDGVKYYAKPKLRQWLELYIHLFHCESDKNPEPTILEFYNSFDEVTKKVSDFTVKKHDEHPIIKDRFRETQIEYILRNASGRASGRYFPTRELVLDAVQWYIKKFNVRTDEYPEVYSELLNDSLWMLNMLHKKVDMMNNCADIIASEIKHIQDCTINETFLDINELIGEVQGIIRSARKECEVIVTG